MPALGAVDIDALKEEDTLGQSLPDTRIAT
jgi:hypothetical protein